MNLQGEQPRQIIVKCKLYPAKLEKTQEKQRKAQKNKEKQRNTKKYKEKSRKQRKTKKTKNI